MRRVGENSGSREKVPNHREGPEVGAGGCTGTGAGWNVGGTEDNVEGGGGLGAHSMMG